MNPIIASLIFILSLPIAVKTRASWYGDEFKGGIMANGEPFNPNGMTCASNDYPLGSFLEVSHLDRKVWVRVTDRGPDKRSIKRGVTLDLSRAAFERLANPQEGLIQVSIKRID